jgi:hypothetical protein
MAAIHPLSTRRIMPERSRWGLALNELNEPIDGQAGQKKRQFRPRQEGFRCGRVLLFADDFLVGARGLGLLGEIAELQGFGNKAAGVSGICCGKRGPIQAGWIKNDDSNRGGGLFGLSLNKQRKAELFCQGSRLSTGRCRAGWTGQ